MPKNGTVLALAFVGILGAVSLLHTKKVLVSSCRVQVVGIDGVAARNVRVSESWDAYSYDLSGGKDIYTDSEGEAVFPEGSAEGSLFYWTFRPIITAVTYGAHASFGTTAFINVSDLTKGQALAGSSFSCSDEGCIMRPFDVKLVFALNQD